MTPSLYIHIPFCRRKCIYCNFYSDIYDTALASSYIDVLIKQIDGIGIAPSTIYIGGGTPTVLTRPLLEKFLKALSRFTKNVEFTFEANPDSLDGETLKLLSGYGVDRLSIGIQSFDDRKLKKLGRIHSASRGLESVLSAHKTGFKNISIDLIFGVWEDEPELWKRELEQAVRLPLTHISSYELTYEKNTPLYGALKAGTVKPVNDDTAAGMYETAIDILSLGGFKQYEVSNFARPGFECRHNLNYWENNPYIGLGASAVSYMDGVRAKNVSNIGEYLRRFEEGRRLVESSEQLSSSKRAKETAAIKIRTRAGIDFKWFKENTGYDFCEIERKALGRLIEDGLIKYTKTLGAATGVRLKRKGFLFCDTVSSALL